jgi:hypothetical protein
MEGMKVIPHLLMNRTAFIRRGAMILLVFILGSLSVTACSKQIPANNLISNVDTTPTSLLGTAEQYLERGMGLAKEGQYEQAIKDFTKAIDINFRYTEAYYKRTQLYASMSEWDMVVADCNKIIEIDPVHTRAYYMRGVAHIQAKEYEDAITDLNMAIDLEITGDELRDLKESIDLVVPQGELILLNLDVFSEGGIDCQGKEKPYNNTLNLQVFVNPGDAGIDVNNIDIRPSIGGKSEVNSPRKYFDNLGIERLVVCVSSSDPPSSTPYASVDYKLRSDQTYKKSNERICTDLQVGRLICPRPTTPYSN